MATSGSSSRTAPRTGLVRSAAAAAILLACAQRSTGARAPSTRPDARATVQRLPTVPASPPDAGAARLAITAPMAVVRAGTRLRLDGADPLDRPGSVPSMAGAVAVGQALGPGDVVESDLADASIHWAFGCETELGAATRARLAAVPGSDLVLSRGGIEVRMDTHATRAFVLDTPALRLIAQPGSALHCIVADGGETACQVIVDSVQGVRSPAAPPSMRGARVFARQTARHPESLDVNLRELVGPARAAPVSLLVRDVGLVFAPDGSQRVERVDLTTWHGMMLWRSTTQQRTLRAQQSVHAVSDLARAGAGDQADATDALRRLAVGDGDATEVRRVASAALGRAVARRDRARELASRGGDVTELVVLAPLADVVRRAWVVLGESR